MRRWLYLFLLPAYLSYVLVLYTELKFSHHIRHWGHLGLSMLIHVLERMKFKQYCQHFISNRLFFPS